MRRPLATKVQPSGGGGVVEVGVLDGDGVGLWLGLMLVVKRLKSHCKSMEGLGFKDCKR